MWCMGAVLPGGAHREEDRPCNATAEKLTVGQSRTPAVIATAAELAAGCRVRVRWLQACAQCSWPAGC